MKSSVLEKIKTAPKEPGCYIFYQGNKVLYVGKAANLRNRLKSYLKVTDIKTESLHEEVTTLDYIVLRSDIEALIEESRLIKELKPKYNILWRDDKSYLYVAFTREKFPKVFITHASLYATRYTLKPALIGPFTDGNSLRLVMKLLRRYFPYCTCTQTHLRDCLNAQIGKCLGYCCKKTDPNLQIYPNLQTSDAFVDLHRYKRNIRMIKAVLRGQSKKLLKTIKDDREKEALEKIFEHRPYLTDPKLQIDPNLQTSDAFVYLDRVFRVECYDISNLAGKEAVGAMTTLNKKLNIENQKYEWIANKSQWRKFKIKSSPTRDDPRMIYEVVSRRLNHPEWPYPDLIIIDGGITQYNAAKKALETMRSGHSDVFVGLDRVLLISFAKPQRKIIGWENPPAELQKLVEQAIYQTHNFVIRYHRQMRRRDFLPK